MAYHLLAITSSNRWPTDITKMLSFPFAMVSRLVPIVFLTYKCGLIHNVLRSMTSTYKHQEIKAETHFSYSYFNLKLKCLHLSTYVKYFFSVWIVIPSTLSGFSTVLVTRRLSVWMSEGHCLVLNSQLLIYLYPAIAFRFIKITLDKSIAHQTKGKCSFMKICQ